MGELAQLAAMCEAVLPAYRVLDLGTCMEDVVPQCMDELMELPIEATGPMCAAFCAATVALCTAAPDKCTDPSTLCPKVLCKMGLSDSCPVSPGEAWDWCDLGTGLDGIELRLKEPVGNLACNNSSRTFVLGKDAPYGEQIYWKCSGTDQSYPAAAGPVRSDVTLEAHVERKCNPWPDCQDSCRLHWTWDATPGS